MTAGFGIRAAALPTWRELHGALLTLDRPTPCHADPDSWTDPRPEDVARIAAQCTGCPVLVLCDRFAVANREISGIWAGRDRQPKRGRPAAQQMKEAELCTTA